MQVLKRNPLPHSPLLWLMLLGALWACLGAQTLGFKTASGQIYGQQAASWESTPWQAAPRLGLRASASESVSAPPVGANGGVGSAAKNIYADTRPMESVFPELKGINPHYVEDAAAGVNTNCASCVNAAQQRLTGQNPNAVASPSAGYANENALLPSAPFGFGNPTTPVSVIAEMQQAGNGAARPLIVQQNGVDHVINVVNRNGQVYFVDTQLGQIVTLQPNVVVKLGRPL